MAQDAEMLANANPIKQISHRARETYDRDDDIYAAICHSERVVRGAEQLLRRRVAHYGHKMMVKERPADFVSREGPTAWQWHQDFGYWHNNGHPTADMCSCFVAFDRCTPDNGCLQLLRGSHKQLLPHVDWLEIEGDESSGRTGALPDDVDKQRSRYELVQALMDPGDALYFHCQTLHHSEESSTTPRWAMICCYDAVGNQKPGQPVQPAVVVDEAPDAVRASGQKHLARLAQGSQSSKL